MLNVSTVFRLELKLPRGAERDGHNRRPRLVISQIIGVKADAVGAVAIKIGVNEIRPMPRQLLDAIDKGNNERGAPACVVDFVRRSGVTERPTSLSKCGDESRTKLAFAARHDDVLLAEWVCLEEIEQSVGFVE